jgi:hypothetical protein
MWSPPRGLSAHNAQFCLLKNMFVAVVGRKSSTPLSAGGTNGFTLVYNIDTQDYQLLPYNQESVVLPYTLPSGGFWAAFFAKANIISTGAL